MWRTIDYTDGLGRRRARTVLVDAKEVSEHSKLVMKYYDMEPDFIRDRAKGE